MSFYLRFLISSAGCAIASGLKEDVAALAGASHCSSNYILCLAIIGRTSGDDGKWN
jgi:hypothetical protein